MTPDLHALIQQMNLEEKASLCSGLNQWQTKAIERLNIPSIWVSDGPHGLRVESSGGFYNSLPATCFPTASALGATWNTALLREVGEALGKECQAQGVQILLGPGINMKRSPLAGRNFEYYSEDPLLSGALATAFIRGVQSQGVGTCLKHFAANNQEHQRMSMSSEVEERTLREIYLPAFEMAVKEARPWSLMCAYNPVNGVLASENEYLLNEILKKEWGFAGIVISDWGAVHDRALGLAAGLHLEMPGSGGVNDRKIVEAVEAGTLAESRLDEMLLEFLKIVFKAEEEKRGGDFDALAHHALARKASEESICLLKNEDAILPLPPTGKIAVIGEFAKAPRFQGGGSSKVNPTQSDNLWEQLQEQLGESHSLTYAAAYAINAYREQAAPAPQEPLLAEAIATAKAADLAILVIGLPDSYELESSDREHIDLPPDQHHLIREVLKVQERVVVVLINGSAVRMPWHQEVKGIVEAWLGGQAGAAALANVLTGKVNPSGKLSETFPQRLADNPSYLSFPGAHGKVIYGEGIFIGYRYYEKKGIAPLFPFGHGLSYTHFSYQNLHCTKSTIEDSETLDLSVEVKNIGSHPGKEVVQLYVKDEAANVQRPEKELKAFQKIHLAPGETQTVYFTLSKRAFAFYDVAIADWRVASGTFTLLVGSSSQDIRLQQSVQVNSTNQKFPQLTAYTTLGEFIAHPKGQEKGTQMMDTFLQMILSTVGKQDELKHAETKAFFTAILRDLPLYKLPAQSKGLFSETALQNLLSEINKN